MVEFVQSGSARLCVDHRGTGGALPIVFLHAGVADRRMWDEQLTGLAAEHQVVAYDRRGFGETQSADEAYSQVGDLRQILDHYRFERVLLIGASQGGRIALDFALSQPGRVAGMVLIAPAVSGEDSEGFAHPHKVQDLCQRLAAHLPNAKAMVIADTAHLPNMEKPAVITLLISEFSRGLTG